MAAAGVVRAGQEREGADRTAEVLGLDVEQAAEVAGRLLTAPDPHLAAAVGVWRREDVQTEALSQWLASLPATVDTGPLNEQAALDDWARRSATLDMRETERFLAPDGSDCGIANVNIGPSGQRSAVRRRPAAAAESGSDAWKSYMRRATNTVNYSTDLPLAQRVTFA